MKLTLADTKFLKDSVSIIADLVTEVRFKVTKNGLELVAMGIDEGAAEVEGRGPVHPEAARRL